MTPAGDGDRIRRYRPEDRAAVYDVCVRTADIGSDARGRFESDDLPGDIWAGPYVDLEPESAFVVEQGGAVVGYVIAAADTRAFVERWRIEWLPYFAGRYERNDDTAAGFRPERMLIPELDEYPAHLHIDLLPEAQGRGWGRALIRRLLAEVRERGVPGVHLGVHPDNSGAIAFYRRLGFVPLPSEPNGTLLGIRTDAEL